MAAFLRRISHTLTRAGAVSLRTIDPRLKDTISQLVVEALMARGPQKISQIADCIRSTKGSSSRNSVRQRTSELIRAGIVCSDESHRFGLSQQFLRRWWDFFSMQPDTAAGGGDNANRGLREKSVKEIQQE